MPLTHGYPHPELLETIPWLAEHLNDPSVKIIDARPVREYQEGHVPGALHLPTPAFKAQESFETCAPEEFAAVVGALGIRASDTVICYDAAGPAAARIWWAFTRFGHQEVRFLHGGIRQWQAAGHLLEMEPRSYSPVSYELGEGHDAIACTLPQAVAKLDEGDVLFWDTRTPEEYTGERNLNNPADRGGHIPRAVHLEWNELVDPATSLFKTAEEMRRVLEAKGITPEQEIVAY